MEGVEIMSALKREFLRLRMIARSSSVMEL
jgi:hypothetical protein